jgi:Xaa-Pro aminopeptidase
MLITSDINRNYLSGFTGSSGALLLTPKKAVFLTDSRYTVQANKEVKEAEIHLHQKALLVEAMSLAVKSGCKRMGFESLHVSVAHYEYMKTAAAKTLMVPVGGLVEQLRQVKDAGEKARMLQAARITDRCFNYIIKVIKPGLSEKEVAAQMEYYMRSQGATGASFETIVASGWRGALPHGIASDKKIEHGDMIVLDFGCIYQGYCSDMSRTIAVGKVSSKQKKVYNIVRKAQQRSINALKAGAISGEVDELSRGLIRRAGYGKCYGHGLGHGVGMEVHEGLSLAPRLKHKFSEGVAVTVEPGIYLEGEFGVRIEDLGFVEKDGYDNLYRSTKDLIVI